MTQGSRSNGRLTFERWNRSLRFLPAWLRCWLHAHLPERLQRQAWDALDEQIEAERLGESENFAAELERLAELAPEPWATKLRAILDEELAR
jgi:hypothetical protein